jgi:hypothetical protein
MLVWFDWPLHRRVIPGRGLDRMGIGLIVLAQQSFFIERPPGIQRNPAPVHER